MPPSDIDEIYEELLQIYRVKYPHNPRQVLHYKVTELVREGSSREKAILKIYEDEGRVTHTEAEELGEAIRKRKMEAIDQQIREHEKSMEKLSLLYSEGELPEESYKAAIKPLEEVIAKLRREKEEDAKSPDERLAALKREESEAPIRSTSGSVDSVAPSQTAQRVRWSPRTIWKYFIHGFLFSILMLVSFFVWVGVLVFLVTIGSFIGLLLGFIVLLLILSGLNSLLAQEIWSISIRTSWMSLLGHGLVLFIALIIAHVPTLVIGLTVPSSFTMIILFIIEAFVDGFVAKNVAYWWEE